MIESSEVATSAVRVAPTEEDPRERDLSKKSEKWFGIGVGDCQVLDVYLLDFELPEGGLSEVTKEILVDPVIEQSFTSYSQVLKEWPDFDWLIQIGLKPGVKDGVGERTQAAIEEQLDLGLSEGVYTCEEYLLTGNLDREDCRKIARDLLANDLINRITVLSRSEVEGREEELNRVPRIRDTNGGEVHTFPTGQLSEVSHRRNLALSEEDIDAIADYVSSPSVVEERKSHGLTDQVTDVELEVLAQTQSEHCKHKIFNAEIDYFDRETGRKEKINSLMDTYVKRSTEEIDPDWVLSTFWDNAGVVGFDSDYAVSMKFETHNSPSAKEPYGGSITGIVGVYRDPMGTGQGCQIIAGAYGFCTPDPFYDGELKPEISPRRLLEGIVEGVKDGGNKSGVPTITGYSKYNNCFLGKPLVYVGALGLVPRELNGKQGWEKDALPGDRIVMVGGRVGRDGIHGVTESSLEFGEHITSGHVQIGDPFTQKKAHDFLMEARDRGLYRLIWDLGGGGLSSAVGETAEFSGGCEVDLDDVPLKYQGLNPWEILVSESQERMLLGVDPDDLDELEGLADRHDVEITDIGRFTDSGKFHIRYDDDTVAYLDLEFMHEGFPSYHLQAEWSPPEFEEPSTPDDRDPERLILDMLSRSNIASKEWIQRQYDHEVQGTSVIKPLVGEGSVKSDASVIQPLRDKTLGLALGLGNNFEYSQVDPYWMTASSLDESIRRVISVGASFDRIALNDNFCWPNSLYDEVDNPQGKSNLGKLVRACKALYKFTTDFETPCISGKDSMFIDGNLEDEEGNVHKVSGIPALQFSAMGRVADINNCLDLVPQQPGDPIYMIGMTRKELGGSEYYTHLDLEGGNVPRLDSEEAEGIYRVVSEAIRSGLLASCHGCYRGGLGVALAEKAIASQLGMEVSLSEVPSGGIDLDPELLYSESTGRFLVTVKPEEESNFQELTSDIPSSRIGEVTSSRFCLSGLDGGELIDLPVGKLTEAYKSTFEEF